MLQGFSQAGIYKEKKDYNITHICKCGDIVQEHDTQRLIRCSRVAYSRVGRRHLSRTALRGTRYSRIQYDQVSAPGWVGVTPLENRTTRHQVVTRRPELLEKERLAGQARQLLSCSCMHHRQHHISASASHASRSLHRSIRVGACQPSTPAVAIHLRMDPQAPHTHHHHL